ncbi:hypothetical protein REPUB_Repub09cG0187900 [Reevesia pubescens]
MMETFPGESKIANAKKIVSVAASFATMVMLVRSIAQEFLPYEFKDDVFFDIRKIFNRFSSTLTMVIDEFNVSKPEKENKFNVTLERNQDVVDIFNGIKFHWVLVCKQFESTRHFHNPQDINSTLKPKVHSFELSFSKKHKEMVLNSYLPHIVEEAKSMKQEWKTIKLFTIEYENMYGKLADSWRAMNLDHPATFETLALDAQLKDAILQDLQRFLRRKDHYRKVWKAWKRGYLLYGPPGTGKSSLIVVMANYLNFDVYDLELTDVRCNSELKRLLVATGNRSILVVEDIECTVELQDRMAEARVTLSGLLNFIDGLWSSYGDDRTIVFTTNHKAKLDPTLLRSGRMDVHIHMSYCSLCGFRILASNYLGIKDHLLFGEIEEAIRTIKVTSAKVAKQLLRSDDLETVIQDLIEFLKVKKIENQQAKTIKSQAESVPNKEAKKQKN